MGGIEAAARRGTCEALGDLDVPSTADIVSGVVAGLGKSRLNISQDIGEFSRTSVTSLREANASLKEELKVAHAEGDAKDLSSAVPELWFCSSGGVCVRMRVCSEPLYL